jgi:F-type H+-transporting ATPase subunit c
MTFSQYKKECVSFSLYKKGGTKVYKKVIFFITVFALVLGAAGWALAAEEAAAPAAPAAGLPANVKVAIALGAGFGIAIAAFGGALGQSRGIVAALEGIARNPAAAGKIVTPMIIGLALIESLVIYTLVISFLLWSKL